MTDKRLTLLDLKKKNKIVQLFKIKSITADLIEPKVQPWLWEGYIPLCTATLFAGSGGLGKSQLLLHIASLVSNGASFSINSIPFTVPQGSVLLLSGEDDEEFTISSRLMAAKANLSKITLIQSVVEENYDESERFICLDQDIALIKEKIKEIGDVKLIVIDPITAYLGKVKENSSSEVRNFILKLNKLAKDNNLAIILNTHLRKKSGESIGSAVDEILGSIAWSSTVRSAFAITRHPDDKDTILFLSSKSNYKNREAFAYKIVPKILEMPDKKIETSAIEWLNQKIDITADEAVDKNLYENKTKIKACQDMIVDLLTPHGCYLYKLLKHCHEEGFNETVFYRSSRGLKIIKSKGYGDEKKMYWSLDSEVKFD